MLSLLAITPTMYSRISVSLFLTNRFNASSPSREVDLDQATVAMIGSADIHSPCRDTADDPA
jgi:hypothetical protein